MIGCNTEKECEKFCVSVRGYNPIIDKLEQDYEQCFQDIFHFARNLYLDENELTEFMKNKEITLRRTGTFFKFKKI